MKTNQPTHENPIATIIVDCALRIHRQLGPGLLESVYEMLLAHEQTKRGMGVERQKPVPIIYDGIEFPDPFRIDLLVAGKVLIELKSVEELDPVHYRQTLTYMKLARLRLGLLINFSAPLLKDGLHRLVDCLDE